MTKMETGKAGMNMTSSRGFSRESVKKIGVVNIEQETFD